MTWVWFVRLPLVPVIVIVYVPLLTLLVDTFIVEEPEPPVTGLSENVGFGPLQLAVNVTDPVNPPLRATVTVKLAVLPARTEALLGEAEIVKPCGAAETVCVMLGDVLTLKFESPPYCAVIGCVPTESEEVENFATLPLRLALPI